MTITPQLFARRRAAWSVPWALTLLCLSIPRAAEPSSNPASPRVAFVAEIAGTWFVTQDGREPKPLVRGTALSEGSLVRPATTRPGDRITIVHLDGSKPLVCTCSESGCSCGATGFSTWPVEISAPRAAASRAERLWLAVERFFSEPPGTFTPVISRGEDGPADGVVRYADGTLDLRSVMRRMPGGEYELRIEPLARDEAKTRALSIPPATLAWKPDGAAALPVDPFPGGPYRLTVRPLNDGGAERAEEAWVLILSGERYSAAAAAFAEATGLTESWKDAVPPSTIRGLLRAWLEVLAGHPGAGT